MTPRLLLDRYVYEDIYPAFKATTDEKEITANLSRAFLNYLGDRNLVIAGEAPAIVGDIGCGPCDTLIKYLTGVRFQPGFMLRATDYLPEYADPDRGEALRHLSAAQSANTLKIAGFAVQHGDAFAGNLLDLLSRPHERSLLRRAFNLVYASHVMYHAESSADAQRMLADIANNLLADDGICILFHIANRPGTFQEYRARFGSQAGAASDSDTGAVTIDDPPAQISAACAQLRLPLYQMEFVTNLHFVSQSDDEWRAFKDPAAYDALAASKPAAYEDLRRFYFIVQRAPVEFAADRSSTGLETFIDQIRPVIAANHGALPSLELMQVFSRTDAAPILSKLIPEALGTLAPSPRSS